jgi:hypothetical protein
MGSRQIIRTVERESLALVDSVILAQEVFEVVVRILDGSNLIAIVDEIPVRKSPSQWIWSAKGSG